jgi:hypothetical protein
VISYDGKRFRHPYGAEGPAVTYRQDGDLLWAEIPPGGTLRRGSLAGRCAPDGTVDFAYCMVFNDGTIVSGRCHSTPMPAPGGGIRLREEWERYGPDGSTGVSFLDEEVAGGDNVAP